MVGLVGTYAFTTAVQQEEIPDLCKSKETRKTCKTRLDKYEYDASKSTRITFKNKKQEKEIEVPLFMGERYRFVFSTEGLPQDIGIEIYDKKKESKKRSLLFSNKDVKDQEFVFEPEKSKKLYVNYIIPETSDHLKKGCVVFVVGFKSKFKKDKDS